LYDETGQGRRRGTWYDVGPICAECFRFVRHDGGRGGLLHDKRGAEGTVHFFQLKRDTARKDVDFRAYIELQVREIQRHKWIESEKAGRDLGQDAVSDWIHRHAASFREAHGGQPNRTGNRSWIDKLKKALNAAIR